MKRVTIIYSGVQAFRGTITFDTNEVFYKNSGWYREVGYLPEGAKRKRWFPIGGKHDEVNDYSETELWIEDIE